MRTLLIALFLAGCGGAESGTTSSDALTAPVGCTDRGDADIPTAMVTESDAETACLVGHCIPNVQCGDPGRTTCVEPHGVHGLTGIWSCPLGCCY